MGHVRDRKEWIILDRLCDIILSNVPGCIVDIGMGLSTDILGEFALKFGRNQYSCDISWTMVKRYRYYKHLHSKHCVVWCNSTTFVQHLHDFPIAIAFLDGSHKFSVVKPEFLLLLEFMATNGVIFIHDTNPLPKYEKGCGDVYRMKDFIRQIPSVDHFLWPYLSQAQGCGLSMIIKRDGYE